MRSGDWMAGRDTCNEAGIAGDRRRDEIVGDAILQCDEATLTPGDGASQARIGCLLRAIEGEIVPRLVLARRVTLSSTGVVETRRPDQADVKELVRLLLIHEVGVAREYVEALRQGGATFDFLCLSLLAPAARELGLLWETDECDFMQVTVALCKLHQLLRELSLAFPFEVVGAKVERSILLAPLPGDQHTFGVALVGQFLRKAGWQVWGEFSRTTEELVQIVRHHWFVAVGLSVGSETRMEELVRVIGVLRHASLNRSVGVMVGGPLLVVRPELARDMGADATAVDGQLAVQRAEKFCLRHDAVQGESSDGP